MHCFSEKHFHYRTVEFSSSFESPSLLKALVRNMIATAVLICEVHAAAGNPLSWQQGNGHVTVKQFCGSKTESRKGEVMEPMSCCVA